MLFFFMPGVEGHWIWLYSGIDLSDSFWGPNHPNNTTGNADDCGVMVLKDDTFWWEDHNCLGEQVEKKTAAPICQHAKVSTCPGGPQFGVHCYLFMDVTPLPWKDAEQLCNYFGSHLASIHSVAENNFIYELLKNSSTQPYFWLGGSDTATEVDRFSYFILIRFCLFLLTTAYCFEFVGDLNENLNRFIFSVRQR